MFGLKLDEKYSASSLCAWGLTLSGAAFGVAGILALFVQSGALNLVCVVALASMTAFAVACANFAAAAAMHAVSGASTVHWPTFWPSLILTLVFAIGSAGGVHLGWLVLADMAPNPEKLPDVQIVDIAAAILCVAKPAMTWIIEGRKAIDVIAAREVAEKAEEDRRRTEAAERDRLAAQERIAKSSAPVSPQPNPSPAPLVAKGREPVSGRRKAVSNPGRVRRVVAGIGAAATVLTAAPAVGAEHAPTVTTETKPTASSKLAEAPATAAEQRAAAMLAESVSLRKVERDTGLSYARVRGLREWVSRAA